MSERGLHYNYVFFNPEDDKLKRDVNGYYYICTADLEGKDNIKVVTYPLDYANSIVRRLFWVHHSVKINRIINLPMKRIWYPYYFKNEFKDDKPICFICGATYANLEYLRYLKKTYPNARFIKIYRDLTKVFHTMMPEFTPEVMDEIFDLRLSFDKGECNKFGMIHFDEFESVIDLNIDKYKGKYDVFFAGKVKDRLPILMDVYHRLTKAGLRCNYYLTEVPVEKRIAYPGIEYADKKISYREMVERTIAARCVLDVNQKGAVGYTSRFLEAVMYSKKLLTNNSSIKTSPFFDERYIFCFNDAEEIDPKFVSEACEFVDYGYQGEFSPISLINKIDMELVKKFG